MLEVCFLVSKHKNKKTGTLIEKKKALNGNKQQCSCYLISYFVFAIRAYNFHMCSLIFQIQQATLDVAFSLDHWPRTCCRFTVEVRRIREMHTTRPCWIPDILFGLPVVFLVLAGPTTVPAVPERLSPGH